jgi:hypothetical protein
VNRIVPKVLGGKIMFFRLPAAEKIKASGKKPEAEAACGGYFAASALRSWSMSFSMTSRAPSRVPAMCGAVMYLPFTALAGVPSMP